MSSPTKKKSSLIFVGCKANIQKKCKKTELGKQEQRVAKSLFPSRLYVQQN